MARSGFNSEREPTLQAYSAHLRPKVAGKYFVCCARQSRGKRRSKQAKRASRTNFCIHRLCSTLPPYSFCLTTPPSARRPVPAPGLGHRHRAQQRFLRAETWQPAQTCLNAFRRSPASLRRRNAFKQRKTPRPKAPRQPATASTSSPAQTLPCWLSYKMKRQEQSPG